MTQTPTDARAKPFKGMQGRSVRGLLLFMIGAAMLPVFLIGFSQAYARLIRDQASVQQTLSDGAALETAYATHAIETARQALANVSLRPEVRLAGPDCADTLTIAQLAMPQTSNVARIAPSGAIICSASPIRQSPDMNGRSWWQHLPKEAGFSFAGPATERGSGRRVLVIALGLAGPSGVHEGHIVSGIDISRFEAALQARHRTADARVTLRDSPETASGLIERFWDAKGVAWLSVTETLAPGRLALVYAIRADALYQSTFWHVGTDIALPMIALLFASAAAWFAIELWAIRPAEELRRLAARYAAGDFAARLPELLHGPLEMVELRDEMGRMASRVTQRDALLRSAAQRQAALVRELHHRVKNNLQMVISLLSLQARQSGTPEHSSALDQAQGRIAAMALVQKLIVETDAEPSIDACLVITELCEQIRRRQTASLPRVTLSVDCANSAIPTEAAMPFALFVYEAVTNAYRHGFAGAASGGISVRFSVSGDSFAALEIADTGTGWNDDTHHAGTGHRLLKAFARQLRGKLTISPNRADGPLVCMTFDARPILERSQGNPLEQSEGPSVLLL